MATTADYVRYNSVARALHWSIGVLILFNLFTGIFGEGLEKMWESMPVHKATGLLILLLSLVRFGWRLRWTTPDYPVDFNPGFRKFAAATHGTFYLLMLILPVTGWIFTSAGKYPLSFYGLFDWPKLALTKDMPIVGAAHETHEILGYAFAALVVLHVGAALYHHFALKDPTLRRML
ncbi:cytochrome b [Novosphingobium cyanobacteriorum]|uniref:Cytochrome b n=1 Tax=Novosphingobium cyanobacteriorum TaxID=3024215 RepID=A0ABT6CF54_9SPHN|nr:cytochrome b [Novosphingobium cyanobacteriorum]MDF8332431.1 cytochrome b [Novosphingobium cyanobacteriorum]